LDSSGNVATTLAGSQLLINGVPAPPIYAATNQLNAIVPYEAASSDLATVQVIANILASGTWQIPVAPAAPSIFTLTESGIGPGAILNADSSVNSAANPASRGSIVQIFATGGGQTNPSSTTGAVAPSMQNLASSATVSIGGVNAPVIYAGAAPEEVSGAVQINATVPQSVAPGSALPVVISVGNAPSQTGVTIAVK
jgi:uncharacterized protein (TIGR03437 family)